MRIAVVGAMMEEVEYLLQDISCSKEVVKNGYTFWQGSYAGHEIILTVSGIGKVAAAVLSTTLVNNFSPLDLVINIGISGGVAEKITIGDVVTFNKYAYYDADVTCFPSYVYGQIPGCPEKFLGDEKFLALCMINNAKAGMVLTGDMFFTKKELISDKINKYFKDDNVISLDIESTAYAQSFWDLKVPFASIRVISDIIGSEVSQYEENVERCSKIGNVFLLEILKKI